MTVFFAPRIVRKSSASAFISAFDCAAARGFSSSMNRLFHPRTAWGPLANRRFANERTRMRAGGVLLLALIGLFASSVTAPDAARAGCGSHLTVHGRLASQLIGSSSSTGAFARGGYVHRSPYDDSSTTPSFAAPLMDDPLANDLRWPARTAGRARFAPVDLSMLLADDLDPIGPSPSRPACDGPQCRQPAPLPAVPDGPAAAVRPLSPQALLVGNSSSDDFASAMLSFGDDLSPRLLLSSRLDRPPR